MSLASCGVELDLVATPERSEARVERRAIFNFNERCLTIARRDSEYYQYARHDREEVPNPTCRIPAGCKFAGSEFDHRACTRKAAGEMCKHHNGPRRVRGFGGELERRGAPNEFAQAKSRSTSRRRPRSSGSSARRRRSRRHSAVPVRIRALGSQTARLKP